MQCHAIARCLVRVAPAACRSPIHAPLLALPAAGAREGGQLAEPHSQAYLIAYPLLFLAARTATWWAARQLGAARFIPAASASQAQLQQVVAAAGAGCGEGAAEEPAEACLPAELLPLVRGAWLLKLPSCGGGGGAEQEQQAEGSDGCDVLQQAGSSASSLDGSSSGSLAVPCSSLCCVGGGWGWLGLRRRRGGSSGGGGRQRFFQLSTDGACLRWSWHRWVLMPHVEAVHCWWVLLGCWLACRGAAAVPGVPARAHQPLSANHGPTAIRTTTLHLCAPSTLPLPPPPARRTPAAMTAGPSACSCCSSLT